MSTNVVLNGQTFVVPSVGERNYGKNISDYLIAIAAGTLQKSGGNVDLTADLSLGSNFGLLLKSLTSISANAAQSGVIRLANTDKISFRNAGSTGDLLLGVNSSNKLEFNGSELAANADLSSLTTRVTTAETDIDTLQTDVSANTTALALKLNKTSDTASNLAIADRITFTEGSAPTSPAAGKLALFADATDHSFYTKDETGAVKKLGGGGLTPTDATALPTTLANGVAYQLSQSASTTALLPVTALAATIEVTDAKGTCNATNFIGITAGAGDTILYKGVPVTDRFVIRRRNATVRFNKAAGSTVWEVTYQTVSIAPPATASTPGLYTAGQNPGIKSDVVAAAGNVGESIVVSAIAVSVASSPGISNVLFYDFTEGDWDVTAMAIHNDTAGNNFLKIGITSGASSYTGCINGYDMCTAATGNQSGVGTATIPRKIIRVAPGVTTRYFLTANYDTVTQNVDASMTIRRVR